MGEWKEQKQLSVFDGLEVDVIILSLLGTVHMNLNSKALVIIIC